MDGSQVGVFEQGDEVGLSSLLQGEDGRRLEAKVGLQQQKRVRVSDQLLHDVDNAREDKKEENAP